MSITFAENLSTLHAPELASIGIALCSVVFQSLEASADYKWRGAMVADLPVGSLSGPLKGRALTAARLRRGTHQLRLASPDSPSGRPYLGRLPLASAASLLARFLLQRAR